MSREQATVWTYIASRSKRIYLDLTNRNRVTTYKSIDEDLSELERMKDKLLERKAELMHELDEINAACDVNDAARQAIQEKIDNEC